MRIMHFVDSLAKGGMQNGLLNLIERLDTRHYEHVVYAVRSLGVNAERLSARGVRVVNLPNSAAKWPVQIPSLIRAIREARPDIIHSRNWGAIEAVIAGRWSRSCAVVHSEHGLDADTVAREPWRRRCFRRVAFELADQVLSVSFHLRDMHAKRTGFCKDRIEVIHNGVDSDRFLPNSATRVQVRKSFGMSEADFCIGCVGNLTPVKDYPTLLQALREFGSLHERWRLLLIGDGPQSSSLAAFVNADPTLKKRVVFLGSSDRVPELLNAMDAYVSCSLIEGVSNSLLEAMATGLPAIVTATGGNVEVVADGDSGLLFPVGNIRRLTEHLLFLQTHRDLRLQLGQQAMRRVRQEFSIDSMVQKYEHLYESVALVKPAPLRAVAGV
jgi:sugar transferase (PEP-CTERM/EpsH1 system associated)